MGHVSRETMRAVRLFRKPPYCLPVASFWDAGVMSTTGKALFLSEDCFEPFANSFWNTALPPAEGLAQSREAAYSTVKTAGLGGFCGFRAVALTSESIEGGSGSEVALGWVMTQHGGY